jgi:hypothetical protein
LQLTRFPVRLVEGLDRLHGPDGLNRLNDWTDWMDHTD